MAVPSNNESRPNSRFTTPRLAFSPTEAADLTGVGRTFLYAALSSGELRSSKIGSRRLIQVDALREWLERHEGQFAQRGGNNA